LSKPHDVLRYFLFSEIPFGQDGDVTIKRLEERYSSDLSNGLGNLAASIKEINKMLSPILSETSEKIDKIFGGEKVKVGDTLFPRLR